MTGPLAPLFAQVRGALDTLHYYGAAERHTDDDCPVCGSCDEGYDALSSIERHVQDMEKQAALDAERAAVLSSAVGKARLILNDASAETTALIDAALPAREKGEE